MAAAAAAAVAASKAAHKGSTEAEEERQGACPESIERGQVSVSGVDFIDNAYLKCRAVNNVYLICWRCIFTAAWVFVYATFFKAYIRDPYPSEYWYRSLHDEETWKDAVKRVDCTDVSASGPVLLNCELDEHGSHTPGPGVFRNNTHAGAGLKTITEVLRCRESCMWPTGYPCTHRIEWMGDQEVLRYGTYRDRVRQTDSESFNQSCGVQNPELSRNDTDFPYSGRYFAESIGVGSFKVMTKATEVDRYDRDSHLGYRWGYRWMVDTDYYGGERDIIGMQIPLDVPVEWPAPLPEGWEPAVETYDGQRSIVYYRKPAHPSGVLLDGHSIGTIRTRFMSNDWKRKNVTVVGEVTERRSNKTVIEFRSERCTGVGCRPWQFWYDGLWAGTWSEDELWKQFFHSREPYFTAFGDSFIWTWGGLFFCIFWLGHLLISVPCLFCMDPWLSRRQVVASAVMACAPALAIIVLQFALPWIWWTSYEWIGLLLALPAVALCSIRCCCCPRACVVLTPCTQRCLEAVKPMSSKPMGKQPTELEVPPSKDVSGSNIHERLHL